MDWLVDFAIDTLIARCIDWSVVSAINVFIDSLIGESID